MEEITWIKFSDENGKSMAAPAARPATKSASSTTSTVSKNKKDFKKWT